MRSAVNFFYGTTKIKMDDIQKELSELNDRKKVLEQMKYKKRLLDELDIKKNKTLRVELTYEVKDSNQDEYALTIDGDLKISYMFKNKNVTIDVKYDSYQTWHNRDSPYVECTVDTSGDGGKFMKTLLQKYQTESDWNGLMEVLKN